MGKKNILITGASGQLGSELRAIWESDSEYSLFFIDRDALDLSESEIIQEKIALYSPDYIVHAGAYTAVDLAETETELADKVNHLATLEIAKYAEKHQTKLLFVSTDYVFQGNEDQAISEDYPTNPINVYGQSKRNGELAVLEHCPDAIIIRTSWVYSIYGKNFVKTMLHLMKTREEINVVADQIGSPTYTYDLALLIQKIIKTDIWVAGIYHYSNEGRISWFEFAKAIKELSGLNCKVNPIASSDFPTAAKRPAFSLLNTEKVKRTFQVQVPHWKDSLSGMLAKILK